MFVPTISVIIPVYAIEYSLLRCCLQTLSSQDYKLAEFIIIDDGSPDDCGQICDEFASRDARFNVIHIKNAGVSAARNLGMEKARGDYLLFVDADDGICPEFLSKLALYLKSNNSDIIFFNFTFTNTNGASSNVDFSVSQHNAKLPDCFTLAKSIIEHTDSQLGFPHIMFGSPWGKAFRRQFLKKGFYEFPVGIKKTQDRIFMVSVLSGNPTTSYFNELGYVYVEHESSVCRKYNPNIMSILNEAESALETVIQNRFFNPEREQLIRSMSYLRLNYFFSGLPISYFHKEGNKQYGFQKTQFMELCREYQSEFTACKISMMPSKQKKCLLALLKMGLFGTVYDLLSLYYRKG